MKKFICFLTVYSILILFNGCTEDAVDPCDGIICTNGDCVNGSCDCEEGWGGSYCSEQLTPSLIDITSIKVTRFPAITNTGGGWDLTSGPDIYVDISYNGTVGLTTTYYENANSLQEYNFSGDQIEILNYLGNVTEQFTISLYDYDFSTLDSDFMGGINWTPYSSNNGFPTTVTLDAGGDVAFELTYSYSW